MFLLIHLFLIYLLVHFVPELTQWKQCIETKDISLPLTVYKVKKTSLHCSPHFDLFFKNKWKYYTAYVCNINVSIYTLPSNVVTFSGVIRHNDRSRC